MIVKTYYQDGRVGDGLVDCNHLAWASAHYALSAFASDGEDGIDVEAEVCRLIGFDLAAYEPVEGLTTDSADNESEESRF